MNTNTIEEIDSALSKLGDSLEIRDIYFEGVKNKVYRKRKGRKT